MSSPCIPWNCVLGFALKLNKHAQKRVAFRFVEFFFMTSCTFLKIETKFKQEKRVHYHLLHTKLSKPFILLLWHFIHHQTWLNNNKARQFDVMWTPDHCIVFSSKRTAQSLLLDHVGGHLHSPSFFAIWIDVDQNVGLRGSPQWDHFWWLFFWWFLQGTHKKVRVIRAPMPGLLRCTRGQKGGQHTCVMILVCTDNTRQIFKVSLKWCGPRPNFRKEEERALHVPSLGNTDFLQTEEVWSMFWDGWWLILTAETDSRCSNWQDICMNFKKTCVLIVRLQIRNHCCNRVRTN